MLMVARKTNLLRSDSRPCHFNGSTRMVLSLFGVEVKIEVVSVFKSFSVHSMTQTGSFPWR